MKSHVQVAVIGGARKQHVPELPRRRLSSRRDQAALGTLCISHLDKLSQPALQGLYIGLGVRQRTQREARRFPRAVHRHRCQAMVEGKGSVLVAEVRQKVGHATENREALAPAGVLVPSPESQTGAQGTGCILTRFEQAGLRIVAAEMVHLSRERAEAFYEVHKDRPFYGELVEFMTSGPVVVQVLDGEGAVAKNREVMGATNPADAAPGTIRAEYAESIEANSVHGSDAAETAATEIAFFFEDDEIVG